jgi:hypothetical protein
VDVPSEPDTQPGAPTETPPGPARHGPFLQRIRRNPRVEAGLTGAAYGVLAALGFVLALVGGFHSAWTVAGVPVVAIAAAVVNLAAFWAAGWAMRSKIGALVPAVVWLIVAVTLKLRTTEGDSIVVGSVAGEFFLTGGALAAALAVGLAPGARPRPPDRALNSANDSAVTSR